MCSYVSLFSENLGENGMKFEEKVFRCCLGFLIFCFFLVAFNAITEIVSKQQEPKQEQKIDNRQDNL